MTPFAKQEKMFQIDVRTPSQMANVFDNSNRKEVFGVYLSERIRFALNGSVDIIINNHLSAQLVDNDWVYFFYFFNNITKMNHTILC